MESLTELLIYDGQIRLYVIVWSLFAGIAIATIIGYMVKIKFGQLIRKIIDSGADSPENARSLSDLGLQNKFLIKIGLKNHTNYKNILVAVTDDGKYYANSVYTDEPPKFRTFVLQHRLTRIERIEMKKKLLAERKAAEEAEGETNSETEADIKTPELIVETPSVSRPSRVDFNVNTAKYYIPDELRDRAASMFYGKPTKLIFVILALIVLGIVAYYSDTVVDFIKDFFQTLIKSFSRKAL